MEPVSTEKQEQFAAIRRSVLTSPQWHQLGKAATDTYTYFALFANRGEGHMFAAAGDVALALGYTERGIRKAIAELLRVGMVKTVTQGGRGKASTYDLSIDLAGGPHERNDGSERNSGSVEENNGSVERNDGSVEGNQGSSHQSNQSKAEDISEKGGPAAPPRLPPISSEPVGGGTNPEGHPSPAYPIPPIFPAGGFFPDSTSTAFPGAGAAKIAVPSPTRAQAKPKGIKAGKGASARPARAEEDTRAILASSATRGNWWLYGIAGIYADAATLGTLPASQTHWSPRSRNVAVPEPDCSIAALAAFFDTIMAQTREKLGLPPESAMPATGAMVGIVGGLVQRFTRAGAIAHLSRVCDHWPSIQAALGNYGRGLALNAKTLAADSVIAQSDRLAAGQDIARPAPQPQRQASSHPPCTTDFDARIQGWRSDTTPALTTN